MAIKVVYFASLKETLGRSENSITVTKKNLTVLNIWQLATDNSPKPDNILAAVNMEYVDFQHPVIDNDEVGFFPPVTGG